DHVLHGGSAGHGQGVESANLKHAGARDGGVLQGVVAGGEDGAGLDGEGAAPDAAAAQGQRAGLHVHRSAVVEGDADAGRTVRPDLVQGAEVVEPRGRPGEEVAQRDAALQDEGGADVVVPHAVAGKVDGVAVGDSGGAVVIDQPAEHGEEAAA